MIQPVVFLRPRRVFPINGVGEIPHFVASPGRRVTSKTAFERGAEVIDGSRLRDLRPFLLDLGGALGAGADHRDMTGFVIVMVPVNGHHQFPPIGVILGLMAIGQGPPAVARAFGNQPIILGVGQQPRAPCSGGRRI